MFPLSRFVFYVQQKWRCITDEMYVYIMTNTNFVFSVSYVPGCYSVVDLTGKFCILFYFLKEIIESILESKLESVAYLSSTDSEWY